MNRYLYLLQCIVLIIGFSCPAQGQYISTYAGSGMAGYTGDAGNATLATLDSPTTLAMDGGGNLYINDQFNNCVRKVTPSGIISTVAGNGSFGFSGDNGPAVSATLGLNWGMTVDAAGNIYIADQSNHRVRKVNTAGIITTIAGTGTPGYSGDGGQATAARFKRPIGIAVDNNGNVFVGDADTSCVRKITPGGIITTYAGNSLYGFSGDGGQATAARLSVVFGLATDAAGNLYICDGDNNRIRMVNTAGIINTIAGNGAPPGFAGDGMLAVNASLYQPLAVSVTSSGVVYFSDCKNHRVRKINKSGIISTIAGTGLPGYNGDGIPATTAQLSVPIGVAVDTLENVYVSDMLNVRIRKINNVLSFVKADDENLAVCENSGPVPINDILAVRDINAGYTDIWTLDTPPTHGNAIVGFSAISTGGVIIPSGLTYEPAMGYTGPDSFTVKVTNSLSSDIIKIYVSVDPLLSPGVIIGGSSVCVGQSTLFTNIATGGIWSSANGLVSLVVTDTGCQVIGMTAGIDVIKYTVTNGCGTAVATKAMTVNPLPDVGVVSGPEAMCLGSSIMFSSSVPGGTWATSNLNASVTDVGIVKGLAAGSVTIIYTTTNAWCSAVAIKVIEIETFPSAGELNGPAAVCIGDQVTLTSTVPGGDWSNDKGLVTVDEGTVTGLAVGVEYINYNITNSCGTAHTTKVVTVRPLPPVPTIISSKGMLSVANGYAAYQWKFNDTNIPGANADTLYAETPGTYEVQVFNEFGCSAKSDKYTYEGCGPDDIRVYPNPSMGYLYVEWCRRVTARLITIDGREVGVVKNQNYAEMHNIASGVYLLVIYDSNGIKAKTYKIVILR